MGTDGHIVRVAAAAALAAAIGLAGCGRKGPLEAPPSAAIAQPQSVQQPPPSLGEPEEPGEFRRQADAGTSGAPAAPPPRSQTTPMQPKKSFFLDWLLN